MPPVKTIRDEFAIPLLAAALTAHCVTEKMMRASGAIHIAPFQFPAELANAYKLADAAIEMRIQLPATLLTDEEVAQIRGQ